MSDLIALLGFSVYVVQKEIPNGNLKNAKEMATDVIGITIGAKSEFDLKGIGWDHFNFHTKGMGPPPVRRGPVPNNRH